MSKCQGYENKMKLTSGHADQNQFKIIHFSKLVSLRIELVTSSSKAHNANRWAAVVVKYISTYSIQIILVFPLYYPTKKPKYLTGVCNKNWMLKTRLFTFTDVFDYFSYLVTSQKRIVINSVQLLSDFF